MRKLIPAVLMLIALAAPVWPATQKLKSPKLKEKRFEAVVKENPRDYAGRYVGIDASYILEVEVGADGTLKATSVEGVRRAELKNIRLDGARLTAEKVYEDGEREKFEGLFADRVLNGERTFGVVVSGLNIRLDGLTITRTFYRLFTEPR